MLQLSSTSSFEGFKNSLYSEPLTVLNIELARIKLISDRFLKDLFCGIDSSVTIPIQRRQSVLKHGRGGGGGEGKGAHRTQIQAHISGLLTRIFKNVFCEKTSLQCLVQCPMCP